MAPPARVAHLIESDGPGGAERVLAGLAGELERRGCPGVAVLPAGGEGWLTRELTAAGVPVEHVPLNRPFSIAFAGHLAEIFRRYGVTLAHSHEFTMAVSSAWAAWRSSIRHVITMHGSRYYAGRVRRRVALRAAIAMSETVAVSRGLRRDLARDLWIPSERIGLVANGAGLTPVARSTLRDELRLDSSVALLVSVGNLYPVKGHRFLLEALALLSRSDPTLHVAIAGRGDLEPELRDIAQALGVASRLHLLGLRSDIANLLAAADLFVLPSLSEGLPLALIEAMLAGRPIVASDVGETRAVLADGVAGVLVEPGCATALAEAIARLLANPAGARALGERAAHRAAAEYTVARMTDRYAALYHAALHRRPRSARGLARVALHQ